jgi:flagellar protein FlaF
MSDKNKNNPYAQASGAYGQQAREGIDQRELEGQLLIKAANEIQRLRDRWDEATPADIDDILAYNRKLWMVFFDTAVENPDDGDNISIDLRNNIVNLCNFIFKRSVDILADPKREKLNVLIDINREVAAGLIAKPSNDGDDSAKNPPQSPPSGGTNTSA